jgi:hypothetical protein
MAGNKCVRLEMEEEETTRKRVFQGLVLLREALV